MNDNHLTPKWLIESLEKEFGKFDLDPCASNNKAEWFAKDNFNPKVNGKDGLKEKWFGKVFVNPPYSQGNIPKWIEKAINEIDNNKSCKLIIMLLPSDTSTRWFHKHFCSPYKNQNNIYWSLCNKIGTITTDNLIPAIEIRFLNRINFSNSKNNAKFPSMLVIFQ